MKKIIARTAKTKKKIAHLLTLTSNGRISQEEGRSPIGQTAPMVEHEG
jgi:hypothetical protein